MTMAPDQKKRGFWLEIIFISVLLFLLLGSRSQQVRPTATKADLDVTRALQGTLSLQPIAMR